MEMLLNPCKSIIRCIIKKQEKTPKNGLNRFLIHVPQVQFLPGVPELKGNGDAAITLSFSKQVGGLKSPPRSGQCRQKHQSQLSVRCDPSGPILFPSGKGSKLPAMEKNT